MQSGFSLSYFNVLLDMAAVVPERDGQALVGRPLDLYMYTLTPLVFPNALWLNQLSNYVCP